MPKIKPKDLHPFRVGLAGFRTEKGSKPPLKSTFTALVSWDLNITAVPEPVNVALGIFAGVCVLVVVVRSRVVRDCLHRGRVAFVHWLDAV